MPASSKYSSLLEPQVAIEEIRVLQERLDQDARRIYELSRSLYQFARRTPSGQMTSVYVLYANAWTRFAGMVEQGLRRTSTATRIATASLARVTQEEIQPEEKPSAMRERLTYKSPLPPSDDLVELFGEALALE